MSLHERFRGWLLERVSREVLDPLHLSPAEPGAEPHGVEIRNDERTPMVFVVRLLKLCFGLSHDAAVQATIEIARKGKLIVGAVSEQQSREIAEYMVQQARKNSYPLECLSVRARPPNIVAGS